MSSVLVRLSVLVARNFFSLKWILFEASSYAKLSALGCFSGQTPGVLWLGFGEACGHQLGTTGHGCPSNCKLRRFVVLASIIGTAEGRIEDPFFRFQPANPTLSLLKQSSFSEALIAVAVVVSSCASHSPIEYSLYLFPIFLNNCEHVRSRPASCRLGFRLHSFLLRTVHSIHHPWSELDTIDAATAYCVQSHCQVYTDRSPRWPPRFVLSLRLLTLPGPGVAVN